MKVPEGSWRFLKIQKVHRRFLKVPGGSWRFRFESFWIFCPEQLTRTSQCLFIEPFPKYSHSFHNLPSMLLFHLAQVQPLGTYIRRCWQPFPYLLSGHDPLLLRIHRVCMSQAHQLHTIFGLQQHFQWRQGPQCWGGSLWPHCTM